MKKLIDSRIELSKRFDQSKKSNNTFLSKIETINRHIGLWPLDLAIDM